MTLELGRGRNVELSAELDLQSAFGPLNRNPKHGVRHRCCGGSYCRSRKAAVARAHRIGPTEAARRVSVFSCDSKRHKERRLRFRIEPAQ